MNTAEWVFLAVMIFMMFFAVIMVFASFSMFGMASAAIINSACETVNQAKEGES